MTTQEIVALCIAFFQFVLGPAILVWVTGKANAKPKRKRNASRKRSR
jgi:hypothetical protein